MTRGKRTHTPKLEVHLLREGIGESVHKIEAVVSDNRNRLMLLAGNSQTATFIRSALKPFQALAVTSSGILERYDLTEKDLAIICSSHGGTIEQARQVFNILWRAEIAPTALQCPISEGKQSPLQHNCSGKHAGMLAVCQQRNWSLNTYLHRSHPVQQLILNKVADILSMPGDELIQARDDCGAPTYSMQLQQMAYLYAHLASGNSLGLERTVRAMTNYPQMVSGKGNFDTELMLLTGGSIVSKSGAEGIQCIGRVGEGMGLAIKVADGAKRAKYAVAIHLLRQMGWISPAIAENLAEKFMKLTDHKRLEVIGELAMV
ncbi:L-asparaginase II [Hyella patelloides LEGE 07179]|uniref:L-asparaginase II n=1 Tax=Hyella patelloides LEGE 07179 TaxID=945734 RepID=A0A563VKW6_9CYAN|nr:asparaginase [Hyella patelloides]VEP11987.1 L-asparaginase II [Hyella patelloides LEGE 07179]